MQQVYQLYIHIHMYMYMYYACTCVHVHVSTPKYAHQVASGSACSTIIVVKGKVGSGVRGDLTPTFPVDKYKILVGKVDVTCDYQPAES